ncbi:helix-turn-helix domain-containing protein [Streptomyces tanashiensis]|uniref:helix-turn-helix domain-containing protein n=1 Tax=Streptomyces tanashiensis TaxID=67367 RepID=UPI00167BE58C|nr:helix-turn-helix domain-containing protein [Streptomyces tanashiensis]
MDEENRSAQAPALSRNGAKNHPSRGTSCGVVHENTRHATHFTVVGNHLAQHAELSLTAIGLATHIQSLPAGSPVDIRSLARRFPEGTTRIAATLRELEAHGYLRRTKERTAAGRVVTRTVSCNRPGRTGGGPRRTSAPSPRPAKGDGPPPRPEAEPPPRRREQREPRRRAALPAVPQPAYPTPDLLRTAIGILSGLRHADPRLLISESDAEHLAPGVVTWLEREFTPESVHRALTTTLPPEPLHRPAALLAHRLTAQLPPLPPFRPPEQPSVRHPLHNCDTCDRAYRGPEPGACNDCQAEESHRQRTP